ncbi:Stk1 family PASTA domain-containing Ser/Thr kinase [Actinomyces sp. zg-332]|uniref:Stk1 family PASTA domain-containing Ser/Thr kinase n=1 Tax=Actinomyces sp. zg-332 TaxID=2708340 RepID=UPI001423CBCA|nr:Stk1 family PASTA domain-containing Ser/Thr kinase [Actinomyces sp. zg-332]QPK94642.1 Stk1 family PASTA domain-containing Ser/Thr kinase [Actinomyces sp. zg-332]
MPEFGDETRVNVGKTPSTLGTVDNFIGAVIEDRFKIKSRIARGGMATVYRAEDRRLDRLVAVKIMHPHLADSADFVARFRREARVAAQLTHPGVVAIHDQGIIDGSGYLVMELVEGPNLRTQLKREGSFNIKRSLTIILEILQALYAAHQTGLIHRDVKPENVLITPYGQVKVADFGLARAVSETTAATTNSVLGTVSYMAPEIITTGSADLRTDIYATGVMLYELIAGHPPLAGSTPIQIAYKHVHEGIPNICDELEWVPESVANLIAKFTNRDSQQRPADAMVAAQMVQELLDTIPSDLLLKRADVEPSITEDEDQADEQIVEHDSGATSALTYHHGTVALSMEDSSYGPVGAVSSSKVESKEQNKISYDLTPTDGVDTQVPVTTELVSSANEGTMVKEKKKSKLLSKIKPLYIAVFSVVVVAGFATWWFTLGPGAYINIPKVEGKTIDEAVKMLSNSNIKFDKKYVFSDTIEKDKVVGTNPKDKVYKSSKLMLLISKGVQQINIPNVSGLSEKEATKVLLAANLQLNKESVEVWSEDVEKGKVAGTDPTADTVIPHTKFVTIQISKGREPIQVPNVVGKQSAEAQKIISDAGLKPEVSEDFSDNVAKGLVISQSPNADGTTIFRNDPVKIVVSKGPRTVAVPNVFGKSVNEATSILQQAGFKVNIVKVLGGAFGIVRSTTPGGGEQALPGSTITVTVL